MSCYQNPEASIRRYHVSKKNPFSIFDGNAQIVVHNDQLLPANVKGQTSDNNSFMYNSLPGKL